MMYLSIGMLTESHRTVTVVVVGFIETILGDTRGGGSGGSVVVGGGAGVPGGRVLTVSYANAMVPKVGSEQSAETSTL
jgi:hypothetical protein